MASRATALPMMHVPSSGTTSPLSSTSTAGGTHGASAGPSTPSTIAAPQSAQ